MRKIIAIVGMAGSGKGTVADYLEQKGFPKVYLGGMVYEEVQKRGLSIVEHEREVREDMRRQDGPAVLAKRASEKADSYFDNGQEIVIFDGLYSWSEYKFLKEKYAEDLTVLAIFTPKETRYKRAVARDDSRRKYTKADIEKRDYEEIENIEKGGPIAMADYTIINDEETEQLLSKVDDILSVLIK